MAMPANVGVGSLGVDLALEVADDGRRLGTGGQVTRRQAVRRARTAQAQADRMATATIPSSHQWLAVATTTNTISVACKGKR